MPDVLLLHGEDIAYTKLLNAYSRHFIIFTCDGPRPDAGVAATGLSDGAPGDAGGPPAAMMMTTRRTGRKR